jgi:hypothetical protein
MSSHQFVDMWFAVAAETAITKFNLAQKFGIQTVPGSTLTLQHDCNLVLYAPDRTPLWASNTFDQYGCKLRLLDSGELGIFLLRDPTRMLWSSESISQQMNLSAPRLIGRKRRAVH